MNHFWLVFGLILIIALSAQSIPIDANCQGSKCCGTGFEPCLIVAKRDNDADLSMSGVEASTAQNGNTDNPASQGSDNNLQVSQGTDQPSQETSNVMGDPSLQVDTSMQSNQEMSPTNGASGESQNVDTAAASQSSETPAETSQSSDALPATGSSETPAETSQSSDALPATGSGEVPAEISQSSDALPATGSSETTAETSQPSATANGETPAETSQQSEALPSTGNNETPTETSQPSEALPATESGETQTSQPSEALPVTESSETPTETSQPSEALPATGSGETSAETSQPSEALPTTGNGEVPAETSQSSEALPATGSSEVPAEISQPSEALPATENGETPTETSQPSEALPATGNGETPTETSQPSEALPATGSGETPTETSQPSEALPATESGETQTSQPSEALPATENGETPTETSQPSEALPATESGETPTETPQPSEALPATGNGEVPAETSQSSDALPATGSSEPTAETSQTTEAAVTAGGGETPQTSDSTVPSSDTSSANINSVTETPSTTPSGEPASQSNNEAPVEPSPAIDSSLQNSQGPTGSSTGDAEAVPVESPTNYAESNELTGDKPGESQQANNAQLPTTVEGETTASVPETVGQTQENVPTEAPNAGDTPETPPNQAVVSEVTETPSISSSPTPLAEPDATNTTNDSSTTEPSTGLLSSTTATSKPITVENSTFDVVTNTRHHFESYDDLITKLNQTFEKSYIDIAQAVGELLKNETIFNSSTAAESTTVGPTSTTGRPTVTPKPAIQTQNSSSDGETSLFPDSVDSSLGDLGTPNYSSQHPLEFEPEDESLFATTPSPKHNDTNFLRASTSPGCVMEDPESFKRNAYSTVYSMTDGRPTMLSFLDHETCVGTLSKTGRRTVRSRGILLPQLPLKLQIEAGMFIQNRLYLFDSSPAQKVWSFTYENSSRVYSLKSHSVISVDAFLQVCDILSQPPNFRVKAVAQFSLKDPTCIVYDKMGTPLLSANASEEAISLVKAIRYLMEREFISQINSIYSWLDESFVKSIYLYGSNGELYELYRDNTSQNLWPIGKYRLIPYDNFPIPNGVASEKF